MTFLAPDNVASRLKWFSVSCCLWLAMMYVLWLTPSICFPKMVGGGGAKNTPFNLGFFAPIGNRLHDFRQYPPNVLGIWSESTTNNFQINILGLLITIPLSYALTIGCWRPYAKNVLRIELRMLGWTPRDQRRMRKGLCPVCGYDLRGEFDDGCAECGWRRTDVAL